MKRIRLEDLEHFRNNKHNAMSFPVYCSSHFSTSSTYIESNAVNLSISAIRIPHSQMKSVRNNAGIGSPRYDFANGANIGIKSSLATACKSLGAPEK